MRPTEKLRVVLPVPLLLAGLRNPALDDAVQPQPGLVVISTLPLPPAIGWIGLLALKLKSHGTPLCVTWKGCPPSCTLAWRPVLVELAAMERPIVALPLPEAGVGEVTEIQLGPEFTFHAHPDGAVTLKLAGPPV